MARFDSAIALVGRLLLRNGESVTIRRPVDGAPPDSSKPWEPGATTNDDHAASAVFLDQEFARQAGLTLQEGQQMAFVDAGGLGTFVPSPATDLVIRASGEKWSVARVDTLDPNGQRILHVLTLEK